MNPGTNRLRQEYVGAFTLAPAARASCRIGDGPVVIRARDGLGMPSPVDHIPGV